MYISKIHLKNIRCFKDETIDLGTDGSSFLISGNNGNGKSAILRSIAMGLCDQASAGSLLRELLGDFIRKDESADTREASISIDLIDDRNSYQIKTNITTSKALGFEVVEQFLLVNGKPEDQEKFPWHKVFAAGYGAGLRTEGTEDYSQYFTADAVYSLFKYTQTLQNPELIWRRLVNIAVETADDGKEQDAEDEVHKAIEKKLKEALGLNPEDSISLMNNGIFITSDWGTQELSALGDGHRALTTVIMDIYSWQLLMLNHDVVLQELQQNVAGNWLQLDFEHALAGIIIIDEVENHLHPKLQRSILKKLNDIFPKVQFIISTHSPLCISGAADTETDLFKVFLSYVDENNLRKIVPKDVPAGYRADQVLVDYFGLTTTVSPVYEKKLNDLRKLVLLKARGEIERAQEIRLDELDRELAEKSPLLSETNEDRITERKNIVRQEELTKLVAELKKDND